MTSFPDDFEKFSNLLKAQAAFVHEQTSAAREDAATTLELTGELERRVMGLDKLQKDHVFAIRRSSLLTTVQSFLLEQLTEIAVTPNASHWHSDYAARLSTAMQEMVAWSDDEWDDVAVLEAWKKRLWPDRDK